MTHGTKMETTIKPISLWVPSGVGECGHERNRDDETPDHPSNHPCPRRNSDYLLYCDNCVWTTPKSFFFF